MSLAKSKHETKTILDFSDNITRNKIIQSLRKVDVINYKIDRDKKYIFFSNHIKIGLFKIRLVISSPNDGIVRNKLKDYGGFSIVINGYEKPISQETQSYIRKCNWFKVNYKLSYQMRIKNLVEIIIQLQRLSRMQSFL